MTEVKSVLASVTTIPVKVIKVLLSLLLSDFNLKR
jgi:hypothetical protein